MRFKDYLHETEQRKPSTADSTREEVNAWMKQHSKNYLNALLGGHHVGIFRGQITGEDYQLGDSSKFRRVAANTSNEIQTLIASSKKWAGFPSRERAYICTTSALHTMGYGSRFMVIPADDAMIGICSTFDMWQSFKDGLTGTSLYDLAAVNRVLNYVRGRNSLALPEDDAEGLRRDLRLIDSTMLRALAKEIEDSEDAKDVRTMAFAMVEGGFANAEDYLEHVFDPRFNEFSYEKAEDYAGVDEVREVWITGKCALIKLANGATDEAVKDAIEQIRKDLYDYEI